MLCASAWKHNFKYRVSTRAWKTYPLRILRGGIPQSEDLLTLFLLMRHRLVTLSHFILRYVPACPPTKAPCRVQNASADGSRRLRTSSRFRARECVYRFFGGLLGLYLRCRASRCLALGLLNRLLAPVYCITYSTCLWMTMPCAGQHLLLDPCKAPSCQSSPRMLLRSGAVQHVDRVRAAVLPRR